MSDTTKTRNSKRPRAPESISRGFEQHTELSATMSFANPRDSTRAVLAPGGRVRAGPAQENVALQRLDDGVAREFGRYTIERLLGRGAMGSVYLAFDSKLQRPVALKIPHFAGNQQRLCARFYQEARAAAALRNPHICPVYDVDQHGDMLYLTMAYIEGPTLARLLPGADRKRQGAAHPKLDVRNMVQVARVICKLAAALQKAHDEGVVHRDLKPGNIIIDLEGEPVVTDFGLALCATTDDCLATAAGGLLGSPAYMSPEQAEGAPEGIGPASDIYSLGVVFYEVLTGRLPFEGSLLSVLNQIAVREPLPVEVLRGDVDPRLAAICGRMMAKAVEDRYASMAAVAADLDRFLCETSAPSVNAPRTSPPNRARAALLASVVAWMGLAAAGTGFMFQSSADVSRVDAEDTAVRLDVGDGSVSTIGAGSKNLERTHPADQNG